MIAKSSVRLDVESTQDPKVATTEKIDVFTEDSDIQVGFTFKHTPPKSMTHVDEAITRICSDMSARAYCLKNFDDFSFSSNGLNVEAIIYDDQGDLNAALPTFAASVTGTTMILVWRGSSPFTNFVSDLNYPPVTSSKWKNWKNIRVHGGFLPFVENDLNIHEEKILQVMEEKGITELIMTGHSLGGGIASVAQLSVEAQLQTAGNVWSDYKDKLAAAGKQFVVKTVAFSAPMSIVNADINDPKTNTFLDQIAANSCNIIYDMDPIPHLPGNMAFLDDLVKNVIPQISTEFNNKFPWVLGFASWIIAMEEKLGGVLNTVKKSEDFQDILVILEKFHHYGNVIHYKNDAALPEMYKSYTGDKTGNDDFKNIKWQKSLHVIADAYVNHLCTVKGPGLSKHDSIPEAKRSSRLYWLNEHAILEGKNDVGEPIKVNGWEDCLKKTKENLVSPCMGAVVEWAKEPSDKPMQEREGLLYIKSDIPKHSDNANLETDGGGFLFKQKLRATTFWRNAGLVDLKEGSDRIKGDDYGFD